LTGYRPKTRDAAAHFCAAAPFPYINLMKDSSDYVNETELVLLFRLIISLIDNAKVRRFTPLRKDVKSKILARLFLMFFMVKIV
jgi:hypothetical protein